MKTFFLAVLLLASQNGLTQDHLEPLPDLFYLDSIGSEYYKAIKKQLFRGSTSAPIFRMLLIPSFSPERVVSVESQSVNGSFRLVLKEVESSLWYSSERSKIKVIKVETEINDMLVKQLEILYQKVSSEIKYSDNASFTVHGTSYMFFGLVDGQGFRVGHIYSPKPDSRMDQLCQIGLSLIQYAEEKDIKNRNDLSVEIEKKVQALSAKY